MPQGTITYHKQCGIDLEGDVDKMGKIIGIVARWVYRSIFSIIRRARKGVLAVDWRSVNTYYVPIILLAVHMFLLVARYIYALIMVDYRIISNNPIYLLLAVVFPFPAWGLSTMCEKFSYAKIKRMGLWACIVNALLTVFQPLWFAEYQCVVIPIMDIRTNAFMTKGMVLMLARAALIIPFILIACLVIVPIRKVLSGEQFTEQLDSFRIDHVIDMRKNRKVAYDIPIMRDVKSYGKVMPMYEEDLFTHLLLLGASGTGKTSSCIIPMIICLLKKKVENREKREKELLELVRQGKAYIKGPVAHPTEYDIVPFPEYEEQLRRVYTKFPDCGITCVSPNEAIGDKVVELCEDCSIMVNMIDPTKAYPGSLVDHVGLNPFYVPLDLPEEDRAVVIINQAKVFSETLITVNEASEDGGGEKYFRDLNTSVTSNIAIICMLFANINHRQTNIGEVQECIIDFKRLFPMVKEINSVFHFGLDIVDPAMVAELKKSKAGGGRVETSGLANVIRGGGGKAPGRDGAAERESISGDNASDENVRTFKFACSYVNDELFFKGDVMYDQSRGLRNLINDMISHPRVYKILNARDHYLDFDRTLSRCEVTVINTGIRINQASSTALGLFFLLNQKRSVLRRPINDRQPHINIVDEATQYVHPWMEDAIGLYRQYKCSCTFAFQSLAQLEKTNKTRYIKGLLLTVGNIIVYGRVGVEEMKMFEMMGGSQKITQVQEQNSRTSILADTPSFTTGERFMENDEAMVTASKLRIRSFQEVTWIGSVKGDVQFAKIAKLSFPEDTPFAAKKIRQRQVDWGAYVMNEAVNRLDADEVMGERELDEQSVARGDEVIDTQSQLSAPISGADIGFSLSAELAGSEQPLKSTDDEYGAACQTGNEESKATVIEERKEDGDDIDLFDIMFS